MSEKPGCGSPACPGVRGSTLVEAMVALLMVGMVLFPLVSLVRTGLSYATLAERKIAALNLAQGVMEQVAGLPSGHLGVVRRAASPATLQLQQPTSEAVSFDRECLAALVKGVGEGQVRRITAFDGDSCLAAVDPPWSTLPQAGTVYLILYDSGGGSDFRLTATDNPVSRRLLTLTVTADYQQLGEVRPLSLTGERLLASP